MSGKIDPDRRCFLGTVAMTIAAAQFGMIDSATFERTAASFKNPDHVSIVIHNYRWRLGLAEASRNIPIWKSGLPNFRSSPYPRLRSREMPMARRVRKRLPMRRNSRANIRTGSSGAELATICLRKRRRPLPKL